MASSRAQIEGACNEDGRGASIWVTLPGANALGMKGADCSYCGKKAPCPVNPTMGTKGATGNVACDGYLMEDTDVTLMKSMGPQALPIQHCVATDLPAWPGCRQDQ